MASQSTKNPSPAANGKPSPPSPPTLNNPPNANEPPMRAKITVSYAGMVEKLSYVMAVLAFFMPNVQDTRPRKSKVCLSFIVLNITVRNVIEIPLLVGGCYSVVRLVLIRFGMSL
jgi:hypothetical protein